MTKKKTSLTLFLSLLFSFQILANDSMISQKEQKEVVKAISQQMKDNYIFPEVADKMAAHISKQLKKGKYKKLSEPNEFASQLTKDLLSISHDKHIRVAFNPEAIARQNKAVSDEEKEALRLRFINRARKANFGFKELKILDGNIGYLNLTSFDDASIAGETAVAAMNFLSNTDAIIIDLRQNGGGSPSMIQLISSYLFGNESVHLNNFYWRPADRHTQTWTLPHVSGKKSPDTPVYVLTSQRTFSAAEEFSYNLKNLQRATLIGETTGGGAHPGGTVNATERFQVWLPSGRAINPITNSNWEGTGVEPHVQINSSLAFETAYMKALEDLRDSSDDEDSKFRYSWAITSINAKTSPYTIDPAVIKNYVGQYGPRKVSMEEQQLYYQRGEGKKYKLIALSDTEFLLEGLDTFRVQFEISNDVVVALIGKYDNGSTDKNSRDK